MVGLDIESELFGNWRFRCTWSCKEH